MAEDEILMPDVYTRTIQFTGSYCLGFGVVQELEKTIDSFQSTIPACTGNE
jgi:hypothetical protein